MKITKTITKDEILDALETEPLVSGTWFHGASLSVEPDRFRTCNVCAVGAVIRKATFLDTGLNLETVADYLTKDRDASSTSMEDIYATMDKGWWMLALSKIFESFESHVWRKPAEDETRLGCQLFVEGYFPEELKLVYETA